MLIHSMISRGAMLLEEKLKYSSTMVLMDISESK